jgi:hypothetical protein
VSIATLGGRTGCRSQKESDGKGRKFVGGGRWDGGELKLIASVKYKVKMFLGFAHPRPYIK